MLCRMNRLSALLLAAFTFSAAAATPVPKSEAPGKVIVRWPAQVKDIKYPSKADHTDQPAMYFAPESKEKKPLLVALHSWSADYKQTSQTPYAEWCIEHGWAFIHPNFRGPNNKPEACGSELVVQDILSAVEYVRKETNIDPQRIYLVGASGGGYATLLMAGRAPDLWAACSAWVPISDIQAWHEQSARKKQKYAKDIELACGGVPTPGTPAGDESKKRSALTYLAQAKNLKVSINAGIHDGHTGSVPISQTLLAYNLLANPKDRLTDDEITYFVDKEKVPPSIKDAVPVDPHHGAKKVLFRRESHNVRVTIFEGTHEGLPEPALHWLMEQKKK